MSVVKQILKMIEKVDPEDEAVLDEIDARVWCLLLNPPAPLEQFAEWRKKTLERTVVDILYGAPERMFSRSRDAIKRIRPTGYIMESEGNINSFFFNFKKGGFITTEFGAPTEELAELHAVLQAIEWERNQK